MVYFLCACFMKRKLSLTLKGCVFRYATQHTPTVCACCIAGLVMMWWPCGHVSQFVCVLSSNPVRANKNCYDLKLDQPHCSLEFNKFTVKKGHVLLKQADFHCRMDHNPNSFTYIHEFKINLPTQILTSNTSIGIQKISV